MTNGEKLMIAQQRRQGLGYTEIARKLGVHPSTVSRTLKRAQERLRRCLRYTW